MSFPRPPLAAPTQIAGAVARAYRDNRFYRAKLDRAGITPDAITTPQDLRRVPMTSREELVRDPWALLTGNGAESPEIHLSTGGNGVPSLYVSFSNDDLLRRGLAPLADGPGAVRFGIDAGDRVVNALPDEVGATGLAIRRALQDGLGACVVPAGRRGTYADPDTTLRLLRAVAAEHLFATPSYALLVAERAGGPGAGPGLRSLWLAGEPCAPALRREIERAWGAPAFLYYGSLECGPLGIECRRQDGYHLATNFAHVELAQVGLPGRPDLAARLGEIVVTTFWRRASPLLRFRTEDLGVWEDAPCACGARGRRLRVLGRMRDLIADAVPPRFVGEIEDVVLTVPGVSPWFRVVAGARPRVLLPRPAPQAAVAAVREAIASRLRLTADIDVVPLAPPVPGAFRRVLEARRASL